MTFYCGNDYEAQLAFTDNSSMPFGNADQRASHEDTHRARGYGLTYAINVKPEDEVIFCSRQFERREGKIRTGYKKRRECTNCTSACRHFNSLGVAK
jgi:hypothetical protein